MSRAFVDEDSGSDEADDMHEIPLPLPPGARNYMTPEGAARMTAELRSLLEVERPRAAAALAAAREDGQSQAIRHMSELDRRIAYLSRMNSSLEVVAQPASAEKVVFGLVVRVLEDGGAQKEYRIVGVDESDPDQGLLSWASPVAKALIGKRPGDLAVVRLPQGERSMEVLQVRFPES